MKCVNYSDAKKKKIKIFDINKNKIGSLIPVGSWILNDNLKIELISGWRKKNMKMFFTHFEISYDLTFKYLNDFSINQDNRLLFLIYDDSENFIGHMGLANLNNNKVELDNLMRGVVGGDPRLIYFAELALLNWSYVNLGINQFYVRFFSYNWISKNLHRSVGFYDEKFFSVNRLEKNNFIFHDLADKVNSNVDYKIIEMSLSKERFYKRHLKLSLNKKNL